ncbi:MAG TPA: hypothetical protein VLL94_08335, partial [Nitrospiraceae bacterium]|nr:hypothetical protein [Nitrospiraceae bacterium]
MYAGRLGHGLLERRADGKVGRGPSIHGHDLTQGGKGVPQTFSPIGMNVFVIKGITKDIPLETIFRGVMPFIVAQIILIFILIAFPQIALWLPSTMA